MDNRLICTEAMGFSVNFLLYSKYNRPINDALNVRPSFLSFPALCRLWIFVVFELAVSNLTWSRNRECELSGIGKGSCPVTCDSTQSPRRQLLELLFLGLALLHHTCARVLVTSFAPTLFEYRLRPICTGVRKCPRRLPSSSDSDPINLCTPLFRQYYIFSLFITIIGE